ncbi:ABC-type nickel/cobalt efflux system permease component RcnA [Nonomuraea fuscirosea]|uniref:ABC-type nickel/cobalt efflux system permease component RcnA n=1 Tax=Nonomuraea fuscirosea TaxID=1291556 RepID=A0A2T0NCN1_9ACTN|nr:High-affinity nickel-transporter [Nonomuraea fuscirosea]PRX70626.1 ABC-type nickel/cobalt efflux system permease component RcnA [Nonomuraea fuscirosea]
MIAALPAAATLAATTALATAVTPAAAATPTAVVTPAAAVTSTVAVTSAAGVSPAGTMRPAAHPLGNFSVNHYDGLTIHPDRIEHLAVVDLAEIPTLQQPPIGPPDAYARRACADLRDAVRADADGRTLSWRVTGASFVYRPGAAGLRTSRLTCRLTAPVRVDRPVALTFANAYRPDAVGWREITAKGQGVRLRDSTVPAGSVSGELRDYPADLLSSPLDVRAARMTAEPGDAGGPVAPAGVPGVDVVTRYTGLLADRLNALIGADRLTVPLGMLALLVSLALGAVHAAMPGHGKTVMAAYLAGRERRLRDAVTVAATVTVTHTAGVLVLGVLVTAAGVIAGDVVLSWLGVASGLLITAIGAALLHSARHHRPGHEHGHGHKHEHGHGHGHGHGEGNGRRQGNGGGHGPGRRPGSGVVGLAVAGGLVPSPSALVVLLGAMALGRTAFGVLTVVCYGLGMAATLLVTALALRRLGGLTVAGRMRRLRPYSAVMTAALVLLVGLGVTVRAAAALV